MPVRAVLFIACVACAAGAATAVASGDPALPPPPDLPIDPVPLPQPPAPPVRPPAKPAPSPRSECDRYASPRGSNRARGTQYNPFRTVQRLVRSLRPGMRGCLRRGSYRGDVKISNGGRGGAPVVLRPFGTERARVIGRIWVARGADHVTIEGLYLDGRNARRLPSPTVNASQVRFVGNDVTNRHTAICFGLGTIRYGRARGTVIRRNRVHDCGRLPRTNHDHGIYVEQARDTLIEENWIYGNADRGIQLYPNAQRTIIRRNVIHGNATGIVFSGASGMASSHSLVESNVITGAAVRYNVESYWAGAPIGENNEVRTNCLSAGARGRATGGVQFPAVGFKPRENLLVAPRYMDARKGDFRIVDGGPCAGLLGSPQPIPGPPPR